MARLEWDLPESKTYEFGVDRGVVYPDKGAGAAWVGLTSVDVRTEGGDVQPYYIDGFKYLNVAESTEFAASISAMSTPPEFDVCLGTKNISKGLYATNQWVKRFDFSYRTMVGEGGDDSKGYKLNLIYNALAKVGDRSFSSKTEVADPTTRSIEIATTPVKVSGFRPTSRFVIDSRTSNPFVLGYLESILYGSNSRQPRMPTINEVLSLFGWVAPDVEYPLTFLGEGLTSPKTVTNLFTNPSFEAGTGAVTVYENLFTNPSFEATSGTVEVRRNLILSPDTSVIGNWVPTSGNLSSSGGRLKTEVTTGTPTRLGAQASLSGEKPAGEYRASFKAERMDPSLVGVRVYLYHTTSTYIAQASLPTVSGNAKYDFAITATSPFNRVYMEFYGSTIPVGAVGYISEPLLESSIVVGQFFRPGASFSDPDLTPSWTGTANASESILTAPRLANWAGSLAAPAGVLYKSASGGAVLEHRGSAFSLAQGTVSGVTESEPALSYLVELEAISGPVTITTFVTYGTTAKRVYATHSLTSGERRVVRATAVNPDPQGTAAVTLSIGWHSPAPAGGINAKMKIHRALIARGVYNGPYFDGSTIPKIRRNLYPDPSFVSGAVVNTYSASTKSVSNGVLTINRTTTGSGLAAMLYLIPHTPNTPASARVQVRKKTGTPSRTLDVLLASYISGSGAAWGKIGSGNVRVELTDEWQEVAITGYVSAGAANAVGVQFLCQNAWAIGDGFEVRYPVVEADMTVGEPFNGSTGKVSGGYATAWDGAPNASTSYIYDPDFTTSWSGAANASTSKLTGIAIAGGITSKCIAIKSTRWVKSGTYSLRLIPTDMVSTTSYYLVTVPSAAISSGTAVMSYWQESALTGSLWAQRGRPYTVAPMTQPVQAPNSAGETAHRWTWNNLTNASLVLPHGGLSGSGDVWYDCLGIFEGVYDGPWFAGGQTTIYKKQKLLAKWTGAENYSTSTIEYQEFLPEETNVGDVYIINKHMHVFDSAGYWIDLGEVPII